MYCTECGLDVGERANFCRRCGADLREYARDAGLEPEPSPPRGPPVAPSTPRTFRSQLDAQSQPRAPGLASPVVERDGRRVIGTPRGEQLLAGFGIRAGGLLIDGVFYFAILVVIAVVVEAIDSEAPDEAMSVIILIAGVAGEWLFNSIGWSPGKRALGLRIVTAHGEAPGAGKGLGRTVGAWLSGLAVGLGYCWAAWDRKSQTWHDKMAETFVVRVD